MKEETMKRAFELVKPAGDWRLAIEATITEADLGRARVTIEDVKSAVAFYTATEARVSRVDVPVRHPAGLLVFNMRGFHVTAKGYRMGPAGP